ncbi:MAG: NAD(P)/FAD-dependent oxidoreductase [Defluviitaleaceae bacterium]|nr:NAD(P)/FAD-dependent oxidoreductase [Defluviitaleaceae bacterium]
MRIIVVGGGAAGMLAAGVAAENLRGAGGTVILLEKNEKLGKKLHITGKGRCNLTNDTDVPGLLEHTNTNPRFLNSAFHAFDARAVMDFFERRGLRLKTERGNRVFPESDRADDVNKTLAGFLREQGVRVKLNTPVSQIFFNEKARHARGGHRGHMSEATHALEAGSSSPSHEKNFVVHAGGEKFVADAVIIATGGLSYPATGSTGDGFAFAKKFGHVVTDMYPALVPLVCAEDWIPALEGLSLRNVRVTARISGGRESAPPSKARPRSERSERGSEAGFIPASRRGQSPIMYEETGEMIFTANGVSGPIILRASAVLCDKFSTDDTHERHVLPKDTSKKSSPLPGNVSVNSPTLSVDLKPALSAEQLDARILRDFSAAQNKDFANALDGLLPRRLIETIVALSEIPPHKKVNEITRAERQKLVALLKTLPLTPIATAGFKEAVITKGGVNVREISPSTLMSKKIPGLFFAGEVLDVDAATGGYNLQIAFSTGYLAGISAAEYAVF